MQGLEGNRGAELRVSSPFVYVLCVPTGPDSWRMPRRGRAEGKGTIRHRSWLSCDIQHMPTVCLLWPAWHWALGTQQWAGEALETRSQSQRGRRAIDEEHKCIAE